MSDGDRAARRAEPASVKVQEQRQHHQARVVKVFNATFAPVIQSEVLRFDTQTASVFYCGDDTGAKDTVAHLITEIGFEAVDAGELQNARYLKPAAELIIQLGYKQGLGHKGRCTTALCL